jgi:hypothetical protein
MAGGLTDNISRQNIVNRFADYVRGAANSGISWGTNAWPFNEFSAISFVMGGTTAGKPIEISGDSMGAANTIANAQTVYNVLIDETTRYTRIRLMRALLFVAGGGGNTGSRPTPGYIFDGTAVTHLNANYQQGVSANRFDVFAGNVMRRTGTAQMFDSMRAAYNVRRGQVQTFQVDVCHASCHNNCHNSRARR